METFNLMKFNETLHLANEVFSFPLEQSHMAFLKSNQTISSLERKGHPGRKLKLLSSQH